MGFGSGKLFLPDFEGELDGFTAFHRMIVMLIFLSLDLHAVFFNALVKSFELIPMGSVKAGNSLFYQLIQLSSGILSVSIQLASPVLISLLFSTTALGLMSRAVPQLNAFSMNFPISFLIGLIFYISIIPMFPDLIGNHWNQVQESIFMSIKTLVEP
jgi:flagellar biosynthesis protein FliR